MAQPLGGSIEDYSVPFLTVVKTFQVKADTNVTISAGQNTAIAGVELDATTPQVVLSQGVDLPGSQVRVELTATGLKLIFGLYSIALDANGITMKVGGSTVKLGTATIELTYGLGVNIAGQVVLGNNQLQITAGTASITLDGTANSVTVTAPQAKIGAKLTIG